jgi:hypothetical protein
MLTNTEHASVEEAGGELLDFALHPENWAVGDASSRAEFQRRVGALRIYASVELNEELEAVLRIGFSAPGLSPTRAADHLEQFVKARLPFTPNSEWQVEVDDKKWIHFSRKYASTALMG